MIAFTLTPVAANHKARIGCTDEDLTGEIPLWLSEADPAGAIDQIDRHYRHGGGWRDVHGFRLDLERMTLKFPGDTALPAIAEARLRDERIILFNGDWLVVIQPDGRFRAARID